MPNISTDNDGSSIWLHWWGRTILLLWLYWQLWNTFPSGTWKAWWTATSLRPYRHLCWLEAWCTLLPVFTELTCLSARAQTLLNLNIFLGQLCAQHRRLPCPPFAEQFKFLIFHSIYMGHHWGRLTMPKAILIFYLFILCRLKMRHCFHRNFFGLISGFFSPDSPLLSILKPFHLKK